MTSKDLKKEVQKWKNAVMGECMLTACPLKRDFALEGAEEFANRLKKRLKSVEIINDELEKMKAKYILKNAGILDENNNIAEAYEDIVEWK